MKRLLELATLMVYLLASIALLIISLLLIGFALWEVAHALYHGNPYIGVSLDAIGLIVISMAVFDIAKYLFEEQVVRDQELRSAGEARKTLTKFLVIIIIATTLEALVFIFQTGTTDMTNLLYPTALMVASVLLLIGLGAYQRLTAPEKRQGE